MKFEPTISQAAKGPPTLVILPEGLFDTPSDTAKDAEAIAPPAAVDSAAQSAEESPESRWRALGLDATVTTDGGINGKVPSGCVALHFSGVLNRDTMVSALQEVGAAPVMWLRTGDAHTILYRYEGEHPLPDGLTRLDGLVIRQPGETLALPHTEEDVARTKVQVANIDALPTIGLESLQAVATALPLRATQSTPLQKYSLQGESEAFAKRVEAERPLLGGVCYSGQATAWYAPPNAGKTLLALNLLTDAIDQRRIAAGNVYYVAADDTSSGLATKMALLDDYGVHMLVPGFKGFDCDDLAANLAKMVETESAKGVLVILDTLKKFVDLMKKNDSAQFANTCRKFVMAGGTILGLAHTTKNPRGDGKLQFAGTSDIIDDFDAAYIIQPQPDRTSAGEKVVLFEAKKGRGGSVVQAAYVYNDHPDTPYLEKLASVAEVDSERLEGIIRDAREIDDAEMIAAISKAVTEQPMTKMALAKFVGKQTGVGRNAVIAAIDRYTGDDPDTYHWQFTIGARGAKTYHLLPKSEASAPD